MQALLGLFLGMVGDFSLDPSSPWVEVSRRVSLGAGGLGAGQWSQDARRGSGATDPGALRAIGCWCCR